MDNSVNDRKERGCPICSNHKVVKSTCLILLILKLQELIKNGILTPNDVHTDFKEKVW